MKKNFLLVCLVLASYLGWAQQIPHYSNYMLNPLLLNPAVTGVDNYLDLRTGYRNQWSGLEGAPESFYLSAHMPIARLDYVNPPSSYHQQPQPKRSKYLNNWRPFHRNTTQQIPANHGLGLLVQVDQAGGMKRTDVQATYAYHLPVTGTMKLAAGVAAGITQYGLNRDQISFIDPSDPVVNEESYHRIRPNLSVGLVAYDTRFFAGVSFAQVLPAPYTFRTSDPEVPAQQQRHFYGHAGYRIIISRDVNFIPSVVVKYADPTALSFDVNAKLYLRQFLWLGGSYRHNDAVTASAGFHWKNKMHLGYAYDLTTSALNTVSTGSHEIMLGLTLFNKQGVFSKSQYW
ncbi:PorP/SprF family type IX secretion system membrane protein [Rufibacter roseus]|uniref:Type IX secretion system membrane protein PorP/SprF n=2 Tax=Rufibacter roseus TaxID=1567108 RepID=A0ABW2DLZ2_9BACT|nr:type IX secretion system membrane protein PorP/SprF [Rufibacter roseus]